MCGIGIISASPESALDAPRTLGALLTVLTARGSDASGYGWRTADGVYYVKSAVPGGRQARRLAAHPDTVDGLKSAVVHTRYATLGAPEDNGNNHPVIRPGVVLVHNGHVSNHHEVFQAYRTDRKAVVDSEALAAIVEHEKPNTAAVLDAFGSVRGSAAVAWLDVNETDNVVHVARINGSPFFIGQTPDGTAIGASTVELLRSAARMAGVELTWMDQLDEGTYVRLRDGRIEEWLSFRVPDQTYRLPNYNRPSTYAR